ncbi:LuxR family transcriptional regulator [Arthrobacter sp. STN4]|uniref:LuxR family transcriptional regulator n=1 Tax=Arthrobacter sp. STN4 TaxID=2923276 RepID=UPI00211A085A|nr:LuxR family transcriptional regulator [Arthrobacter sp. STN4]MCQ9163629.1 LuxR C-terminal-related transcriptional regulator [Arthrobacter sp. STN4]
MGAEERRRWSSLVRQDAVNAVMGHLHNAHLQGVAVIGPAGVGKTTLSRRVEERILATTHVIRLFGSGSDTDIPYGAFNVLMARLSDRQLETPAAVLQLLVDLIRDDARGRPVVIFLDELPGIDTASMGVLMQLVLSGTAKLLVTVRSTAELPEDLVWMVKDGLMATERIDVFSRAEVRILLSRALDGAVAESVVSTFYTSSAGNPLVLEALVHEHYTSGTLRQHGGVWVLVGPRRTTSGNILPELVRSRLARLPEPVRVGLEKFALLRKVPLSVALRALGPETVSELEERGFLSISPGLNSTVTLAEPYIGETLRNQLTADEKAVRFQEMSGVLGLDPASMDKQQLLTFAAWVHDAGMVLKPKAALAAARAAVNYFDPQLALACCAHIPRGHAREVQAAQVRSQAYGLLANYAKAVEALDGVSPDVLSGLTLKEYAAWAAELSSSLLWVPDGYSRIEELLADLAWRIEQADPGDEVTVRAGKLLKLARFEFQVHRGEFSQAGPELLAGSKDPSDRQYRLNCTSMLAMVLVTTGRELDAVALSKAVRAETAEHDVVLRRGDWHLKALILALTWTGQWRACESIMKDAVEQTSHLAQYRGGVMELALGLAYVYAGRGAQAADVLLVAAAQLEIRDTYNSLELVYSALAFAFAQINDVTSALRYLSKAGNTAPQTMWVNRSMAEFFQLMALRWLDDPHAAAKLVASAEIDIAKGRFTSASISLFGATTNGTNEQYRLLEETSLKRQGPMAAVNVALARAHRRGSAALALEAAEGAHALELAAVESRCAVVALDLARNAGEARLSREAQRRLDALAQQVPVLPIMPHHAAVPLTARERQVAALAVKGMANREIASRIGVSIRTVEGHLYQVFAKVGITSRSELEQGMDL